jgi:ubiquitin fusion degradation protein 1
MNFQIFQHLQRLNGNQVFEELYSCYSMAFSGKGHLEDGDKILLPPSALEVLARMNVEYPMLFELTNTTHGKKTHCGVLEFSAEEGRCYIPFWMMQNLLIGEGSLIAVKNVSLEKAKFVKFRAQSVDFLEISNPRSVLEKTLRKFTCVTVGDQICIPYLGKSYYLEIREVNPNGAASIIETDCNVDFEEPVGYKESKYAINESKATEAKIIQPIVRPLQKAKVETVTEEEKQKFVPFAGSGKRIDGKPTAVTNQVAESKDAQPSKSGANTTESNTTTTIPPARQSIIGNKYAKKKTAVSAFGGSGHSLSK